MEINMTDQERIRRWRLILGPDAQADMEALGGGQCALSRDDLIMDSALAALYEPDQETSGTRKLGGKGASSPVIAKWLADVRSSFPQDIVKVIQTDAIERKGLKRLLLEPETLKAVTPDIALVSTLMSLKGQIPEKSKDIARELVRKVVEDINRRLENDIRRAVTGALNRQGHSPIPSLSGLDIKRTLEKNLRHFSPELNLLVPERVYFFERKQRSNAWHVILDMDQSGSMATSIIYGSIAGAILASMAAIKTRVVVFDTEVVDLTEQCEQDPVDMLFGIQLGGGTDIHKSVLYCERFITEPQKTIFILLTDLYEGGNAVGLVRRLEAMRQSGVRALCLLALSDDGKADYNQGLAASLVKVGIPCFACTPNLLPVMLEGVLKGKELGNLAAEITREAKRTRNTSSS